MFHPPFQLSMTPHILLLLAIIPDHCLRLRPIRRETRLQ